MIDIREVSKIFLDFVYENGVLPDEIIITDFVTKYNLYLLISSSKSIIPVYRPSVDAAPMIIAM